jgi:hypothetical protein
VHAAAQQGTFVLTTSLDRSTYDSEANIFYSHPDDTGTMKKALQTYSGRKSAVSHKSIPDWSGIAKAHMALYRSLLIHRNAGERG